MRAERHQNRGAAVHRLCVVSAADWRNGDELATASAAYEAHDDAGMSHQAVLPCLLLQMRIWWRSCWKHCLLHVVVSAAGTVRALVAVLPDALRDVNAANYYHKQRCLLARAHGRVHIAAMTRLGRHKRRREALLLQQRDQRRGIIVLACARRC